MEVSAFRNKLSGVVISAAERSTLRSTRRSVPEMLIRVSATPMRIRKGTLMKRVTLLLLAVFCLAAACVSQDASSATPSNVYRTTKVASQAPPTSAQIYYAGGPVMSGSTNVYVVYYGNWSSNQESIINAWLQHIGGTTLYNINIAYHQSSGAGVQNVVNYNPATGSYHDNYSLGKSLTDASIQTIVSNAISGKHLAADTNGVYFVLTYSDVSVSALGGSFCSLFCGYHSPSTSIVTGDIIKYSMVGDMAACPSACDGNIFNGDTTTPNGDIGADGAINVMFHELSESVSDPEYGISGAWGAGVTGESGDLCAWNFGTWSSLPKAPDGAHYNVTISSVNYLIQQMFEVSAPADPVGGTDYSGACQISLGMGIFFTPSSLNFGKMTNSDPPKNEPITFTNNSSSTLTISDIETGGTFGITSKTCGATLASLASCSITLNFDPSSYPPGVYTDTLYVYDNGAGSPQTAALKVIVYCHIAGC